MINVKSIIHWQRFKNKERAKMGKMKRRYLLTILVAVAMVVSAYTTIGAAESELSPYEKAAEKYARTPLAEEIYKWYAHASEPFRGTTIKTILEKLPPAEYLAKEIVPRFEEITGINVSCELASNEEVYMKSMLEATTRAGTYDFFFDDQDMVGTWLKRESVVCLTDLMKEHPQLVEPWLDLDDFIPAVLAMYTDREGNLWNLPIEQYAKPYIYRTDLFDDPEEKTSFKERYGWELRPAKTWDEYVQIAEFFTRPEEDLYGHACVAKRFPGLAYEWTEALFLQGGAASKGVPWSRPICGWGIRIDEDGKMAGASVKRGGMVNSPRMKEFFKTYKYLIDNCSPPGILTYTWEEEAEAFKAGRVAQIPQLYTQLVPPLADPKESKVVGKFAVALPPVTKYWEEGMARGYWDSAGLIIPTGSKQIEASWLFAQFVVSKAHELERALNVGSTVRMSVLESSEIMAVDQKLGGLMSLARSPGILSLTGTDPAIREYVAMLETVYKVIHKGYIGELSPDETMDKLAEDLDTQLRRMGYPIPR